MDAWRFHGTTRHPISPYLLRRVMTEQQPTHIVCAVRGRPESRRTVTYAIDLALEKGARLTFLHILDAEFLKKAPAGRLSTVYKELTGLGEFMMLILEDRARRRGVEQVDHVFREGHIKKQLRKYALETHADILVIGAPLVGQRGSVFTQKELEKFTDEMCEIARLEVILAPKETD